jgi:hypothetical protein
LHHALGTHPGHIKGEKRYAGSMIGPRTCLSHRNRSHESNLFPTSYKREIESFLLAKVLLTSVYEFVVLDGNIKIEECIFSSQNMGSIVLQDRNGSIVLQILQNLWVK